MRRVWLQGHITKLGLLMVWIGSMLLGVHELLAPEYFYAALSPLFVELVRSVGLAMTLMGFAVMVAGVARKVDQVAYELHRPPRLPRPDPELVFHTKGEVLP